VIDHEPFNRQGEVMGRQTIFGCKLEQTADTLTAHGRLVLSVEFNHGVGVCRLADRYLPGPGSNRGYAPSVFVNRLILILQAGGRSSEDLLELRREPGVLQVTGRIDQATGMISDAKSQLSSRTLSINRERGIMPGG
jgi:hypothetical protein